MNVLEIPLVLFQEFSSLLGIGDEWEQRTNEGLFTMKGIVGIDGLSKGPNRFKHALGFKHEGLSFIFVLWGVVPRDDANSSKPVLKITAEAGEGEWFIKAEFSAYGINLEAPSSDLIPLIL